MKLKKRKTHEECDQEAGTEDRKEVLYVLYLNIAHTGFIVMFFVDG